MALMRILMDCSLTEVGRVFGRHYTSVIWAQKRIESDPKLRDAAVRVAKRYKALFA
jgi:chromosomal replication initiation ATPase DnaA